MRCVRWVRTWEAIDEDWGWDGWRKTAGMLFIVCLCVLLLTYINRCYQNVCIVYIFRLNTIEKWNERKAVIVPIAHTHANTINAMNELILNGTRRKWARLLTDHFHNTNTNTNHLQSTSEKKCISYATFFMRISEQLIKIPWFFQY